MAEPPPRVLRSLLLNEMMSDRSGAKDLPQVSRCLIGFISSTLNGGRAQWTMRAD
jgi:hypothetical protein